MSGAIIGKSYLLTGDSLNVTLDNVINYFDGEITKVDAKIDHVAEKISTLETSDFGKEFASIDSKIGSVDAKFTVVDEKLDVLDAKIDASDAKSAVLKSKIKAVDKKIAVVDERVDVIDAKVDAIKIPEIPNYDGEITRLDAKIGDVESKIDNISVPDVQIRDYDDEIARLDKKIDDIQTPDFSGEISAINEKVDALAAVVDLIEVDEDGEITFDFSEYDEKITAVDAKVDSLKAEISAITTPSYDSEISALNEKIDAIVIPDFDEKFAAFDEEIAPLKNLPEKVSSLEEKVGSFDVFVDEYRTFDARIENVESHVATISGGLSGTLASAVENFFTTKDEFKERYAQAPFDSDNVFGLDLSHLIDGENFELDTENLTDGQVTRIRSGSASYNVDSGISRGYVEVKTRGRCQVTVIYSISSESYDYGGCIVTENAPNTTFTLAELKKANFFYKSGKSLNQTATYNLDADKTYYLNFGYAKDKSNNTNDDRFYIHSIRIVPLDLEDSEAVKVFTGATSSLGGTTGLVPAPLKGQQTYFLRGDGTWVSNTYSTATASRTGLLSNSDYQRFNTAHKCVYGELPITLYDNTSDTAQDVVSLVNGDFWFAVVSSKPRLCMAYEGYVWYVALTKGASLPSDS